MPNIHEIIHSNRGMPPEVSRGLLDYLPDHDREYVVGLLKRCYLDINWLLITGHDTSAKEQMDVYNNSEECLEMAYTLHEIVDMIGEVEDEH